MSKPWVCDCGAENKSEQNCWVCGAAYEPAFSNRRMCRNCGQTILPRQTRCPRCGDSGKEHRVANVALCAVLIIAFSLAVIAQPGLLFLALVFVPFVVAFTLAHGVSEMARHGSSTSGFLFVLCLAIFLPLCIGIWLFAVCGSMGKGF